jgi:hypothetical protein
MAIVINGSGTVTGISVAKIEELTTRIEALENA